MSRFEGAFQAAEEASLDPGELFQALRDDDPGRRRRDALTCYLSASEGWKEAVRRVGGAFARGDGTGLTNDKRE